MPETDFAAMRQAISAQAFRDEAETVRELLANLAHLEGLEGEIMHTAKRFTHSIREAGPGGMVAAFLHEYGLNTAEGVAMMCLAEALLRIPDADTADALIHSTFENAQWEKHVGKSDSAFVNASAYGLLLAGKVVTLSGERPGSLLGRLSERLGEPAVRASLKSAMRFIGGQFVMGEDIEKAMARARGEEKKGVRFSYDMLGEGARSDAQAQAYARAYLDACASAGREAKGRELFAAPGISVKLSALHARYSLPQRKRVLEELLPRLVSILEAARQANIAVAIDAEEASRLDIELELFERLLEVPSLAGWNGTGFVVQAYQKRCLPVIDFLAALARKHSRVIPLRLVKGAYWDGEIKFAQAQGLPGYPVFTRKEHTDVSYLAAADKIFSQAECFFPQFATHNARTAASVIALARHREISPQNFEFQRLHGMGESLHALLKEEGFESRVYAPVGKHKDLLAYLIRRLLENGANTSFVNLLTDAQTPVAELLADPVARAQAQQCAPNPTISLPRDAYGAWKNASGIDFGCHAQLETLLSRLDTAPAIVVDASEAEVDAALAALQKEYAAWSETTVEHRAGILERAAEMLEERREAFCALIAKEAGRTLPDALAELREAADFCRYYAIQARRLMTDMPLPGPTGEENTLSLHPLGVFACISPWNFPLSIFTGQIVAALVTGNCVAAKPAEQTPAVAAAATALLHEAGIPRDALRLLPGAGETIGAALVSDPRVHGVVFTGGTDTARRIYRALAMREGPIGPFIAETGGLNCMVVDSSSLLETAVDDIVTSAFGSAGQRCSSLRILMVQDEIADELLALLSGAMQELRLGDPLDPATDIGPVIDEGAKAMLESHIAKMKLEAKLIAAAPLPPGLTGHFVAPHAFEIASLEQIRREVFGPVLHVLRFRAEELSALPGRINATGYGLTFGLHSRIQERAEGLTPRIHAGNVYVNRGMTGAVVGVQPFGGEGLSGTGPKAGGPHYLLRFLTERTRTVNIAAIGGNLQLLLQGNAT